MRWNIALGLAAGLVACGGPWDVHHTIPPKVTKKPPAQTPGTGLIARARAHISGLVFEAYEEDSAVILAFSEDGRSFEEAARYEGETLVGFEGHELVTNLRRVNLR